MPATPPPIKALTLWQPYAQAVAVGLKCFETRSWPTRYRGPLAIHAAAKKVPAAYLKLAEKYSFACLPLSVVVAVVELADCIQMTPEFIRQQTRQELEWGDWQPGRWAWKLQNVRMLATSVPAKGLQGLWNWKNTDHVEISFKK